MGPAFGRGRPASDPEQTLAATAVNKGEQPPPVGNLVDRRRGQKQLLAFA